MLVGCMGAPVARAACIGTHPSHWRQASRFFPVSRERDWLWIEREGRAGKLCPQRQERRGFRLKPSGGYGNPLKLRLEIC